jgi:penicillin-binding protein 2
MSFHPNDVARRGRDASVVLVLVVVFLVAAFFRTQILRNQQWVLQSEENRLREIPLPAARGIIYDRKGKIIAENAVGYSVSLLETNSEDSLRATLKRLSGTIDLSSPQVEAAVKRYRRDRARPTVIIPDATFDVISVLEEHRIEFPSLIIQSAPKRYYPDSNAVAPFVGYTSEISETELAQPQYAGYKSGQQVGKQGLERQYESTLRGKEGSRFVEVDAHNRVVRDVGARDNVNPVGAPPLYTNIDLDLQRFVANLFADSLQGGVVAMIPQTGEVLALYSAPTFDPNRFIGGVSVPYYDSLRKDKRNPLYNKALQGMYPPGSTWKLASAIIALENNLITPQDHMPIQCTGGMTFGNRYWRCWEKKGHGSLDLTGAISKSCDVYFYQLGLKIQVARLIAGGVDLGFNRKSGIDLPEERRSEYPTSEDYLTAKYGRQGWTQAVALNLAIGQGENAQTVLNMARFYTALATDGAEARPQVARQQVQRTRAITLSPAQLDLLRHAMIGVTRAGGTAASAALRGVELAGKTGTAQSGRKVENKELNHAWFVGFAPAENPKIVVAVMLEFGGHGTRAARIASAIISKYLGVPMLNQVEAEGGL